MGGQRGREERRHLAVFGQSEQLQAALGKLRLDVDHAGVRCVLHTLSR
jgi:hypothetical protein